MLGWILLMTRYVRWLLVHCWELFVGSSSSLLSRVSTSTCWPGCWPLRLQEIIISFDFPVFRRKFFCFPPILGCHYTLNLCIKPVFAYYSRPRTYIMSRSYTLLPMWSNVWIRSPIGYQLTFLKDNIPNYNFILSYQRLMHQGFIN